MAEIFLARVSGLPGFQKMVVIKRILPQLATKTDFVEMFLDEARIAATLQHPNVVQMYDVGVVDGELLHRHGVPARRGRALARAHAAPAGQEAAARARAQHRHRRVRRGCTTRTRRSASTGSRSTSSTAT